MPILFIVLLLVPFPLISCVSWNIVGWHPTSNVISFNGTMQIPRRPQGGTPYVWPGVQPQTGGVLQQVCDGRTGNWWIGSGYYGTPSLPWGAGISVTPGQKVRFTNWVNAQGTWTSSVGLPNQTPALSSFALPNINMVVAIFAIELYDTTWTFGPVHYTDVTIQHNTGDTSWCTTPYWIADTNVYIKGYTASVVNGKGTCHIDQVSMLSPTAPPLITPTPSYSQQLPVGAVMLSLRQLLSTYTGKAIRVQRSSDSKQQDIGFINGILDTSSLTSFVGTGDGRVVIWYDQSGNKKNVTAIYASAPYIVKAGTIYRMPDNSLPSVFFDGTTSYMTFNSFPFGSSTTMASYAVIQGTTTDAWQRIWDVGTDSNKYIMLTSTGGAAAPRFGITTNTYGNEQTAVGTQALGTTSHILETHHTGTTLTLAVDGTIVGTKTGVTLSPSSVSGSSNYIGKSQFNDPLYHGYMNELLFYATNIIGSQATTVIGNMNVVYKGKAGVLDASPISSQGAFSLRRLTPLYTGPALKLTRSSDGTTKDIGFLSNGDLDTATALSFVGSGDGTIDTWYDQGPSGNHARQNILELQPILISAGKLNTLKNKPTIRFDTTKYTWLYLSSYPYTSTSTTSSSIAYIYAQQLTQTNFQRWFDFGYDTNTYVFASPSSWGNQLFGIATQGNTNQQQVLTADASKMISPSLLTYEHTGTIMSVSINGKVIGSATSNIQPSAINGATRNFIGRSQYLSDEYLDAYISEMIFYGQDLNTATTNSQHISISNNIANYWGGATVLSASEIDFTITDSDSSSSSSSSLSSTTMIIIISIACAVFVVLLIVAVYIISHRRATIMTIKHMTQTQTTELVPTSTKSLPTVV